MRLVLMLLILVAVAAAAPWGYAAARFGELDLCTASAEAYAAEVPRALDLLSVRHPLSVGLIRGVLNETGAADEAARDLAAEVIRHDLQDVRWHQCYAAMARVMLSPEQIRTEMADEMERSLGLGR